MQPVLALAPLVHPVPETVAETLPVSDGAFLASMEDEVKVGDVAVGPPVMVVVPLAPIALPDLAPPAADTPGGGLEPALRGDVGNVLSKVVLQVADLAPGPTGQSVNLQDSGAAKVELLTRVTHPPAPPHLALSATASADVASAVSRRDEGATVVSKTLRQAAVQPGAGLPDAAPKLDLPLQDGPPDPMGETKDLQIPTRPEAPGFSSPKAQTDKADAAIPDAPVDTAGIELPTTDPAAGALTREEGDVPKDAALRPIGDQGSLAANGKGVTIAPKGMPTDAASDLRPAGPTPPLAAENPELPSVTDSQVRESAVRPGIWESLFTGLSLLPAAEPRSVAASRTFLPVQSETLPPVEPATVPAAEDAVADRREVTPAHRADAIPVQKADPARVVAAVSTAPNFQPMIPSAAPTGEADEDDGRFALLGAGSIATGGPAAGPAHAPVGASGPQPAPVPQVAAQITAALSHTADGATELALSPDELGHVKLRLEPDAANPDRMVVMITFERPETLDLFRRHATELAEALRAAGYAGADIGFGQGQSGSAGNDAPGGSAQGATAHDLADAAFPTPPPSPPRLAAGASLDLRL